MRSFVLLFLLAVGPPAWPQSESAELGLARHGAGAHYDREDAVNGRLIPMPYLSVGPSFKGGLGYAEFAYRAEAGLNLEGTHLVFRALGAYDNGRKVNDNDQPNPKGHDRYLESAIYFRPARRGWSRQLYFGGGFRWNQLSTTNYTKGGSRYELGGGYDWFQRICEACRRDFSMRVTVDWITAGTDWQNGSHGPNMIFTMPSPREKRHWFWRESVGMYRFHTSITEPGNVSLTRQQLAARSYGGVVDTAVLYRF
jgi:hypothetical protein